MTSDEIKNKFKALATVKTPNGVGTVQGYQRQIDGTLKVLVSHDPATPSRSFKSQFWGSAPLILTAYPVDVMEVV